MKQVERDFVLDFESFSPFPDASVIDLAVTVFDNDPHVVPNFMDLVNNHSIRFKFIVANQKGKRDFNKGTIEWWKGQSAEARALLAPTPDDIDVSEMPAKLAEFLAAQGVNAKTAHGYCRGQSFDFPILIDILRQELKTDNTFPHEPCRFWNQRDIRTAIEAYLMSRDMTTTPLPKGVITGFVHHNSVHDCSKAVIDLIYAQRYAMGLDDIPEKDDIDPLSLSSR